MAVCTPAVLLFILKEFMGMSSRMVFGLLLGLGAGVAYANAKERRRFSFHGRTVVITGGSRGLGLCMAREFAREGARLVLLARNPETLQRAEAELRGAGASVLAIPCDLRNQEQATAAIRKAHQHFGSIDVLVNNAGIIEVGPLEHMHVRDFHEAMDIHFYAPLYTTLAALPFLRESGGGRIVNISSIGGKMAFPHLVAYSASKYALVGFSDGIRAELRRENIFVTTVCPGFMRTGSVRHARFKGKHEMEFAWFAAGAALPLFSMDPAKAAQKIVRACRTGSPQLLLGIKTKTAVLMNDFFPGVTTALLSAVNRLMPNPDPTKNGGSHSGAESRPGKMPSWLTRGLDDAASANNEL
jgi:NAD(P)-dependent dehydrogenase (short-subunit alcohol dehydrogenase family)